MDEQKKYEVIKALADHPNGSKERAALTLGCTKRHINRLLAGYRKEGKAFFVHGNKVLLLMMPLEPLRGPGSIHRRL